MCFQAVDGTGEVHHSSPKTGTVPVELSSKSGAEQPARLGKQRQISRNSFFINDKNTEGKYVFLLPTFSGL